MSQNSISGVGAAVIYDAIQIRENIPAEYVVVQGGINDIVGGATAAQMIANVEAITVKAQADTPPKKPIYLAVAPWSGFGSWTTEKQDITDEFNGLLADHCAANDCIFVDAYSLLGDGVTSTSLDANYDAGDGLHLNLAAQQVLASEIYTKLSGLM